MPNRRFSQAGLAAGLLLALVFLLCLWPNARGALSEGLLGQTSLDEPVLYPSVVRMLGPASDLKDLWSRWIIYGDYHYGYPFFFFSALALLPIKLIFGAAWENYTGWNLLILRQMISVLPMLAALWLAARGMTGRRTTWQTVWLLVILVTTRGVFRTFLQWWHPDALSLLAVVLTFVFLQRDDLRFGRDFLFAAAACGAAVGVKLAGLFFAPVILFYLAAGLVSKRLRLGQMAGKAALFLGIMLSALVISNPVVYNAGARQEILEIQLFKTSELDQGYGHDVTDDYAKGPAHWTWTLERWFGSWLMLGFILVSLAVGGLRGPEKLLNRLILAYALPQAVYLMWFVAVKPDHYWLPVLIPAFSGFLNIPRALAGNRRWWARGLSWAVYLLTAAFVAWNFLREGSGLLAQWTEMMAIPGALW